MTVAEEQTEAKQPVDVKQAVRAAIQYVHELYSDDQIFDLSLEEVEHGEEGEWDITVGFTRKITVPSGPTANFPLIDIARGIRGPTAEREYKIVRVDGKTGQPISMKIRAV